MPRYLTTAEVAEVCRNSPETVRFWRHAGRGPAYIKVGRKALYPADEFEAWLTQQERNSMELRVS